MYGYFGSTIELLPANKGQFCDYERNELDKRISTFSKHLKVCLPEQQRFIATFLKDSFKEFLHFLCHNKGENINRKYFIIQRKPVDWEYEPYKAYESFIDRAIA